MYAVYGNTGFYLKVFNALGYDALGLNHKFSDAANLYFLDLVFDSRDLDFDVNELDHGVIDLEEILYSWTMMQKTCTKMLQTGTMVL